MPIHAVRQQNAPLFANRCGFLVLHDCSVAKRVSGHLICSLVRDRLRPQMRFAVGTVFFVTRHEPKESNGLLHSSFMTPAVLPVPAHWTKSGVIGKWVSGSNVRRWRNCESLS